MCIRDRTLYDRRRAKKDHSRGGGKRPWTGQTVRQRLSGIARLPWQKGPMKTDIAPDTNEELAEAIESLARASTAIAKAMTGLKAPVVNVPAAKPPVINVASPEIR